jgi:protein-S-isoprenylcysteine O-methyltransferase Ste14
MKNDPPMMGAEGSQGSLRTAAPGHVLGKVLYGLLFVLLLPAGLVLWARASGPNVGFPPVQAVGVGLGLALVGGVLIVSGMLSLWVFGHGLPMNPYPPSRYVTRGPYRLLRHPIYAGFSLLCIGVALATGSAAGIWLVCPVVILSCLSLVLGYENIDLQKRFGDELPSPLMRIP